MHAHFPLKDVRALVTGGAGFIGQRLVQRLATAGATVTVYDALLEQVHGPNADAPLWDGDVRFVRDDIRRHVALERTVRESDPDLVVHLAADTGTGQSYDEPRRYCDVNVSATAALAETLRRLEPRPRRVILAGSRAVYGEGAYRDADGRLTNPSPRQVDDMAAGKFEITDASGRPLTPEATREDLPLEPASIYASTKLMQEWVLTQAFAGTKIATCILRFQNVYGPGQSLRNPYTGVLSIFCQQILEGRVLDIYEDGDIVRDFVFVDDVVAAVFAAATAARAPAGPVNIGSGRASTIVDVARFLLRRLKGNEDGYRISGAFRAGDVRHAVANIARAEVQFGWLPVVSLEDGLSRLADWARDTSNVAPVPALARRGGS